MIENKLTSNEKIALAIIEARPGVLGRELEQTLKIDTRTRYAVIEGLRDKMFPIIGDKSGHRGYGYRVAQTKEEWEEYEARERADCIKRLKRGRNITKAARWNISSN